MLPNCTFASNLSDNVTYFTFNNQVPPQKTIQNIHSNPCSSLYIPVYPLNAPFNATKLAYPIVNPCKSRRNGHLAISGDDDEGTHLVCLSL